MTTTQMRFALIPTRFIVFTLASLLFVQAPLAAAQSQRRGAKAGAKFEPTHDRRDGRHDGRRDDRRDDRHGDRWEDRHGDRWDRRDDRRDDRHDGWRYQRYDRWEDWVEFRLTLAGARLLAGMIFGTLPPNYTTVIIAGNTYHLHDDVYFVRVVHHGAVSYKVITPPIGATVTVLPAGHTTVIIDDTPYRVYEGVHYLPHGTGYVVVAMP